MRFCPFPFGLPCLGGSLRVEDVEYQDFKERAWKGRSVSLSTMGTEMPSFSSGLQLWVPSTNPEASSGPLSAGATSRTLLTTSTILYCSGRSSACEKAEASSGHLSLHEPPLRSCTALHFSNCGGLSRVLTSFSFQMDLSRRWQNPT